MTPGQRAMAVLKASDLRIDRALALRLIRHCLETKTELADVIATALRSYLDSAGAAGAARPCQAMMMLDEEPELLH